MKSLKVSRYSIFHILIWEILFLHIAEYKLPSALECLKNEAPIRNAAMVKTNKMITFCTGGGESWRNALRYPMTTVATGLSATKERNPSGTSSGAYSIGVNQNQKIMKTFTI